MSTIMITGATDGIGLETATRLAAGGHHLLLHGRSQDKLDRLRDSLSVAAGPLEFYRADLSRLEEVDALAAEVRSAHSGLDVLINNAGVLRTAQNRTSDGLDVRFMVNTIAPYRLTLGLLPLLGPRGRVVNLSSAAQATVDLDALNGPPQMKAMEAYSQSKLAITIWSQALAEEVGSDGPIIVAVNPGSLLASKMVKEGFGIAGNDIGIGADILVRAATSEAFANASGQYFDNDSGAFAPPHRDASNPSRVADVMQALDKWRPDRA